MVEITFGLNRDVVTDRIPSDISVLDYVREHRRLTGTKEVCGEGDCGACTIAVGTVHNSGVSYQAVNSCLMPAVRLHGRHAVTVEGLADGDQLHPVQQALVEHHGLQCGYCTPGMVMSLFCLFVNNPHPSEEDMALAMDGTLCRCTGYASIQRAARALADDVRAKSSAPQMVPAYFSAIRSALKKISPHPILESPSGALSGDALRWHFPRSEQELWNTLAEIQNPADRILLAGGTDTVVALFDEHIAAKHAIDLRSINEWNHLREIDGGIRIGAAATLTDVLNHPSIYSQARALHECLRQMCSTQVRNTATLAGNLCTASPISDTAPVLLAFDADVMTGSRSGTRRLSIRDFFPSYRRTALEVDEMVTAIEIPYRGGWSRFEKSGKRRALDIATVSSAICLRAEGANVADVRLAFGGVAATPFLSRDAAAFLNGRALTEQVIERAADLAADEVHPISDVRGSAGFRRLLVRNHVIKHLNAFLDQKHASARL